MEEQYEYKTKYKQKNLKIFYQHRLYRLVTALYEGDSTKVDTTNKYIRYIRDNIRYTVHASTQDYQDNYGPKNDGHSVKKMYRRSKASLIMDNLLFNK
ncbi:MAG: hypothetical protein HeimC3_46820 [Candidatus Heimdallarchaeota archaeon LC_3]|nr:MAG: hypothetical protein HeimC3_46820 [Candidatus Heimdallarchaeota archaeon LC_3]